MEIGMERVFDICPRTVYNLAIKEDVTKFAFLMFFGALTSMISGDKIKNCVNVVFCGQLSAFEEELGLNCHVLGMFCRINGKNWSNDAFAGKSREKLR